MERKVLWVNVFGEPYNHSQNPPQSPFIKGGREKYYAICIYLKLYMSKLQSPFIKGRKKEILPFSKGELEGICSIFSLN